MRFWKEERGIALIWLALTLVVLIGMAGFGVDLGWMYLSTTRAQKAVDAAALAGVVNLPGFIRQAEITTPRMPPVPTAMTRRRRRAHRHPAGRQQAPRRVADLDRALLPQGARLRPVQHHPGGDFGVHQTGAAGQPQQLLRMPGRRRLLGRDLLSVHPQGARRPLLDPMPGPLQAPSRARRATATGTEAAPTPATTTASRSNRGRNGLTVSLYDPGSIAAPQDEGTGDFASGGGPGTDDRSTRCTWWTPPRSIPPTIRRCTGCSRTVRARDRSSGLAGITLCNLNGSLTPGIYVLHVTTTGQRDRAATTTRCGPHSRRHLTSGLRDQRHVDLVQRPDSPAPISTWPRSRTSTPGRSWNSSSSTPATPMPTPGCR